MPTNTLEKIWENGYLNTNIDLEKVNSYLDQKSISTVTRMQNQLRRNVMINIPIVLFLFILNIWLDNDHAILWGVLSMIPGLYWWQLGRRQLQSLSDIDYRSNCHEYLLAVRSRLQSMVRYNRTLVLLTVPMLLTPMLIYTYYQQSGKTLGEVWGGNSDLPLFYMFLSVPLLTLVMYLILRALPKPLYLQDINTLIQEMEEIKDLN